MIRSQLIARLAQQREHLSGWDVEAAVNTMLEHMGAHLASGGRIEIRGFGSFSLRHHSARRARNPRTGEPVARPARYVVHFKPGRALRERVDGRRDADAGKEEGDSGTSAPRVSSPDASRYGIYQIFG